jgi:chromosome segregation ATPase
MVDRDNDYTIIIKLDPTIYTKFKYLPDTEQSGLLSYIEAMITAYVKNHKLFPLNVELLKETIDLQSKILETYKNELELLRKQLMESQNNESVCDERVSELTEQFTAMEKENKQLKENFDKARNELEQTKKVLQSAMDSKDKLLRRIKTYQDILCNNKSRIVVSNEKEEIDLLNLCKSDQSS